jgi:peptidyl-prolyl cis-trans isomerase C
MRVRNKRIGVALAVGLTFVAACSREPSEPTGDAAKDKPLARVGNKTITQGDVDRTLEQIPLSQKREYEGTRGTLRLVNLLVDRQLMLRAAEDRGLDRDPEMQRQLQGFREGLLLQAYQRQLVEALPKPTDADVRKYYDEHLREFTSPARVNASWIKCATKAEAERARHRIVERGEDFGKVAREVSIDAETRPDGGLLGYFNEEGYIRSIGPDKPEFARHAFELEPDDVGPVFEWDGGWAFIRVHERTSERVEPFERAEERIRGRIGPQYSDSLLQADLAELRKKYPSKVLFDADRELEGKSAEELMRLATEAAHPRDKIDYYRALLEKYPTYERADEAQFMIGFTLSEELKDLDAARPEYQKVIDKYPNSDIKQSALYMLQHMGTGSPMPDFEAPASGGH